jgi:hypothetical protein
MNLSSCTFSTIEDGVYKRRDRKGYFLQWIGPDGKRRVAKATSKYLDGAREERRLYIRGEHPKQTAAQTQRTDITFAQIADKFLAYQKPRLMGRNSYTREVGVVDHLKAFFTGTLADVTPVQVSDYVTMRLGKVGNSSVRKELVTLKHLFRLACGEWRMLPRFSNPCLDVTAPGI